MARQTDVGYAVIGYLLAGPLTFGLIGLLLDWWLDTRLLLPVGVLLAAVGFAGLVWQAAYALAGCQQPQPRSTMDLLRAGRQPTNRYEQPALEKRHRVYTGCRLSRGLLLIGQASGLAR